MDADFKNVIPLLKNALYNLENVEHNKDPTMKEKFNLLLDKEKIIPKDTNIEVEFGNKESGASLMNIGEFLFLTDPQKKAVSKTSNILFNYFYRKPHFGLNML